MAESVVERVARAIAGVAHRWEDYVPEARAAIEAMREPVTLAMAEAGTEARWRSAIRDADNVREIWAAMIDAALSESP